MAKNIPDYHRVGIDKLTLYNFTVVQPVDFDTLTGDVEITRRSDQSFKVTIQDNNLFSDLIFGQKILPSGMPKPYCYLTLCVGLACGINLTTLSYEDYCTYIANTLHYIREKYHITLLAEEAKVSYMEIAGTIPLQEEFCHYDRALRLLITLMSQRLGKLQSTSAVAPKKAKKLRAETYARKNNSIEVILYNKLQQILEENPSLGNLDALQQKGILRLEYRLQKPEKVRDVFQTNRWSELDNSQIITYYSGEIEKERTHYQRWLKETQKKLRRQIQALRKAEPRRWQDVLIQTLLNTEIQDKMPYVLDKRQIMDAVAALPDKNRNNTRVCKALERKLQAISNCCLRENGLEQMEEIFSALKKAVENSQNL